MDDLENAVEDVKLISAMTDEPRPTKPWTLPSTTEVKEYIHNQECVNPQALTPAGICNNCLGFYLYLKHIVDNNEQIFADFITDVAIYKNLACQKNRLMQARLIHKNYLSETANGRQQPTPLPRSLFRSLKSEDTPPADSVQVTEENWMKFLQTEGEHKSIPFIGEPIQEVLETVRNALQEDSVSSAADSDKGTAMMQSLFDKLEMISFSHMNQKHFSSFQQSPYYNKYASFMLLSVKHVSHEDFLKFRVLGRGGFGIVYGCKKCQSGHLYALKVMDRKRIKARRAEHLCITERNLMTMLDSPFIVGLKYAYQTPTEVHLVLEIMTGGDLGYHLRRKVIFNKFETKYYICRTILGIKTLHSYQIIFRDLKPDNILMDSRGRTALSDLGLAVAVPKNGITGACGTRGYWAPEMLLRTPEGARVRYHLSVDWFSLGCLLYQFMSGICPFRKMGEKLRAELLAQKGEEISKDEAIDRAVRDLEPFYSPEFFTEDAVDLIKRLLDKNGKTRLGAQGAAEVMSHPYFSDVNWQEYQDGSIKPPCLPRKDLNYATQSEIGGFSPEEQESEKMTDADNEIFARWNYTRPAAFLEEAVSFMQQEEEMGPIQVRTGTDCDCNSICCTIS